ncbi:MAG TPA: FtsX-like permease family protein [Gammaproteobacteria bacterium]|nr:FtsX-like permease family protein [Gammaproteobacteria bacterium]
MTEQRPEPLALRLSLALVRAARHLVPRAARDRWMREWEAEVRANAGRQPQARLVSRSSGAFADAAFLRRQLLAHYLITALRHFRRNWAITGVNVACLAMGLTCFVVAWGTTAYFGQGDSHQPNASRLYVVIMSDAARAGAPTPAVTPRQLAEHLTADFPQLAAVARAGGAEIPVIVGDTSLLAKAVFADPPLLEMFDLPMLRAATSSAESLLAAPGSAIVSKTFAERLFGTDQVVGRTVRLGGGASTREVSIRGVVGALRQPSQLSTDMSVGALPFGLKFEILLSSDMDPARDLPAGWTNRQVYTYVMLPRDGSFTAGAFNDQLDAFAKRNVPADGTEDLRFHARPIADVVKIWLDSFVGANATGISSTTVLMILGGLVLLVACFNYANLATAQSLTNAREIAVRRVLGAEQYQVLVQYMVEGFVLTAFALALSLAFISAGMLVVEPAIFTAVVAVLLPMKQLWGFLAALVVVVTVCTTAYPATVLCRVPPADVHRARSHDRARSFSTLLVGLQFAFAGFLLVAVFVIVAQNRAMQRSIESHGSDAVVVIANDLRDSGPDRALLKTELARQRGVSAVGAIDFVPWSTSFRFADLSAAAEPSAARVNAGQEVVDSRFFDAMSIGLVAGRGFDTERAADTADFDAWRAANTAADFNVVIDRAMVRRLKLGSPEQAIGKVLYRPQSQTGAKPPHRLHVIGVVEDIVLQPLNFGAPMFYLMNEDVAVVPVIRVAKQDVAGSLARIDATWAKLAPDVPLRRRFANEQYEASYGVLEVIDNVFAALGGLASAIATMGLIGISLHTMRRRTREIAVRKVNGASVRQILWMLFAAFSKPIVIANLAVWPVAYVVLSGYLSLFAIRAGLSAMPFVLSLGVALLVAWLAVAAQATRAARASPALVLRRD